MMSVNMSVRQFASSTLLVDIDRVLANTGVKPEAIKLEITESALMDNPEMAIALTSKLRYVLRTRYANAKNWDQFG